MEPRDNIHGTLVLRRTYRYTTDTVGRAFSLFDS